MRRRPLGRMLATLLAVLAVDALFVVLAASLLWPWLAALDGRPRPALAAAALVVALAVVAWVQLAYARREVLASVDADPATPEAYPVAHAALTRLAAAADCPKPSLAVVDSSVPNSMAVGMPRSATVVVSEGLLEELDDDGVEAVLAHELAHVRNYDAAVLTLASFLPALAGDEYTPVRDRVPPAALGAGAVLAAVVGVAVLDPPGVGWEAVGAVALLVGASLLVGGAALGVLAAFVLGFARRLSRDRELIADRAAARLTGDPASLATALRTLTDAAGAPEADARQHGDADPDPTGDLGADVAVRGLCLLPHGFEAGGDDWHDLLSARAHPPVDRRVEHLRALAAEQET